MTPLHCFRPRSFPSSSSPSSPSSLRVSSFLFHRSSSTSVLASVHASTQRRSASLARSTNGSARVSHLTTKMKRERHLSSSSISASASSSSTSSTSSTSASSASSSSSSAFSSSSTSSSSSMEVEDVTHHNKPSATPFPIPQSVFNNGKSTPQVARRANETEEREHTHTHTRTSGNAVNANAEDAEANVAKHKHLQANANVNAEAKAKANAKARDGEVRTDWTREEIDEIYKRPLMDLVFDAAKVHRQYFEPSEVQQSTLLSIKTGGCTENCGYCSQSQHHKTFVKPTPTMKVEDVVAAAKRAKEAGSTRFCMGSAWREVGNKHAFKRVLEMVKEINGMGLEVCTTLGMLDASEAKQLKEAGLTAYNHNLDTSREYYPKVVSTRSYDDRLETVKNVREAGISVCCGGIVGLGESDDDRVGLLQTLATLPEHPESVPINALVPVKGTPLGDALLEAGKETTWDEMVRMIATARIVMPETMVRLSAGRMEYPVSAQALMFMAGANSIFTGETLLTTANPEFNEDKKMFELLGLVGKAPFTAPLHPREEYQQQGTQDPVRTSKVHITKHSPAPEKNDTDEQALRKVQRLLRIRNGPSLNDFSDKGARDRSQSAA